MTDCIEWSGRRNEKGYGYTGNRRRAHRVAWEVVNGAIPDGLCVLHRCDNPPCVRVEHLFLGTQRENIADRQAKGRTVNPPSRRKLTDEQVRQIRAEYDGGLVTQQALAERWDVSRGNLSRILNRRSYAHV